MIMNTQLARSTALALAAWAATLVIAQVRQADAASKRISALACTDLNRATYVDGAVEHDNDEEGESQTTEVACAVPSDSALAHSQVVTLNVYGNEPTGASNWSRACVRDNDTLVAAACGPTKNWGSGTGGVRTVDVSVWQAEPSHYPFVISKLDAGSSGAAYLFGIYVAN